MVAIKILEIRITVINLKDQKYHIRPKNTIIFVENLKVEFATENLNPIILCAYYYLHVNYIQITKENNNFHALTI